MRATHETIAFPCNCNKRYFEKKKKLFRDALKMKCLTLKA